MGRKIDERKRKNFVKALKEAAGYLPPKRSQPLQGEVVEREARTSTPNVLLGTVYGVSHSRIAGELDRVSVRVGTGVGGTPVMFPTDEDWKEEELVYLVLIRYDGSFKPRRKIDPETIVPGLAEFNAALMELEEDNDVPTAE